MVRLFLAFRDRHSDKMALQTVSPARQKLLKEIKAILVTVVPDCYRPWTLETQSHATLKAFSPTYVALNKMSEPLWTDINHHMVYYGNRHNPCKLIDMGKSEVSGSASPTEVSTSAAWFNKPAGIVVIEFKKKEYAIIADSGNNALRMVKTVSSQRGKKSVITLKCSNMPKAALKLVALTKRRDCEICASSVVGKCILLLEITPEAGKAVCKMKIDGQGLRRPTGLWYEESTDELLVANHDNLLVLRKQSLGC